MSAALAAAALALAATPDPRLARRIVALGRDAVWTPVAAVRLPFRTHHPQGLVRVGDDFVMSAVEVRERPAATPDGGRSPGSGVGHLFRFGPDGALKAHAEVGEGAAYHPGGLDFDGRHVWVPLAEYRPDSRTVILRIDPATLKAVPVVRVADHVGAVARDVRGGRLYGYSWGARRRLAWKIGPRGRAVAEPAAVDPSHDLDFQDCHAAGRGLALCSGVAALPHGPGEPTVVLGGLALVDLRSGRPVWRARVQLRSPSGRPMTQNPFWVEVTPTGLRAWFVPDDEDSVLYGFDVRPPSEAEAGGSSATRRAVRSR